MVELLCLTTVCLSQENLLIIFEFYSVIISIRKANFFFSAPVIINILFVFKAPNLGMVIISTQHNYGVIGSYTYCLDCSVHQFNCSNIHFVQKSIISFFTFLKFTSFYKILNISNRSRLEFTKNCQEIKAKYDLVHKLQLICPF